MCSTHTESETIQSGPQYLPTVQYTITCNYTYIIKAVVRLPDSLHKTVHLGLKRTESGQFSHGSIQLDTELESYRILVASTLIATPVTIAVSSLKSACTHQLSKRSTHATYIPCIVIWRYSCVGTPIPYTRHRRMFYTVTVELV